MLSIGCVDRGRGECGRGEEKRVLVRFLGPNEMSSCRDCYLETNLLRTAHLEDEKEDVEDDDHDFVVWDGEEIY